VTLLFKTFGYWGHVPLALRIAILGAPNDGNWPTAEMPVGSRGGPVSGVVQPWPNIHVFPAPVKVEQRELHSVNNPMTRLPILACAHEAET
jgi:hypothetical protein